MADAYVGTEGRVYVGAKDAKITGFKVTPKVSTADTTTTADGGHEDVCASTKSCDGSFSFLYLKAAGDNPMRSTGLNMRHGSVVDLTLYVFKHPTDDLLDEKLGGKALIENLSFDHTVKGVVTVTATFKSKGPWLYPGDTWPEA